MIIVVNDASILIDLFKNRFIGRIFSASLRIPDDSGHQFRRKAATDSDVKPATF